MCMSDLSADVCVPDLLRPQSPVSHCAFRSYVVRGITVDRTTTLRAPFFLVEALLPKLKAASQPGDPARVISIVSIGALWGRSSNGAYAYGAAKAGIHQLTRMLASDQIGRAHV